MNWLSIFGTFFIGFGLTLIACAIATKVKNWILRNVIPIIQMPFTGLEILIDMIRKWAED